MVGGVIVDNWEDEDGTMHRDAVDGGTTASVIALIDGSTLVHAQVGDSSALLGGTIRKGEDGEGEVTFEELMEEHGATNVAEYERMIGSARRCTRRRGSSMRKNACGVHAAISCL